VRAVQHGGGDRRKLRRRWFLIDGVLLRGRRYGVRGGLMGKRRRPSCAGLVPRELKKQSAAAACKLRQFGAPLTGRGRDHRRRFTSAGARVVLLIHIIDMHARTYLYIYLFIIIYARRVLSFWYEKNALHRLRPPIN